MMRLILPFAAALALSLGITTGIAYVRGPEQQSATAQTKPRIENARRKGADSSDARGKIQTPSTATPLATAVAASQPATSALARANGTAGAESPKGASLSSGRAPDTTRIHGLAKTFAGMQPRTAASVLTHLDDDDIQTILGSLNAKEQAAILGNIPADRAARITRAILHSEL